MTYFKIIHLVMIFFTLFTWSCSSYYVAPIVEMPLYKEKGEVKAGGGVSINGLYGAAAFSPIDHFGINGIAKYSYDYSFGEFGITYYRSHTERISFEVTGGYGIGNFSKEGIKKVFIFGDIYYSANGHFNYPYLQAAIVIVAPETDRLISGVGLRSSQLNYFYKYYNDNRRISRNIYQTYYTLEPLINLNYSVNDFLNLTLGCSGTFFFPGTVPTYDLYVVPFQINIGFQMELHNIKPG